MSLRALGSMNLWLTCSLVACAAPPSETLDTEHSTATAALGNAYGRTYPGPKWRKGLPEQHGLSTQGLAAMNAVAESLGSTCMLVVHDGVLVSEWYAPGYSGDTTHGNLFSVTKSVTSTLFGIAQAKGLLDIDEPASSYIGAWAGTASQGVTIRDLLSNDSGRFWSFESDYGALLFGADQTGYAVDLGQAVPPGTHWEYNNAAIQTLEQVFEVATGQDIEAFAQQHLFGPIGMTASFMRDPAQNALVYQGLSTSCHDIARFGHLFARGGAWKSKQVVPSQWVAEATQPSTELNDAYGYLWWLNRSGHVVEPSFPGRVEYDGQLIPSAPESVFSALGAFGQLVIVEPEDGYVVVRLQEVLDLEQAIATDPDPVGTSKLDLVMTAFEQAKL